jgi:hypothetical protein
MAKKIEKKSKGEPPVLFGQHKYRWWFVLAAIIFASRALGDFGIIGAIITAAVTFLLFEAAIFGYKWLIYKKGVESNYVKAIKYLVLGLYGLFALVVIAIVVWLIYDNFIR